MVIFDLMGDYERRYAEFGCQIVDFISRDRSRRYSIFQGRRRRHKFSGESAAALLALGARLREKCIRRWRLQDFGKGAAKYKISVSVM